MLTECEDIVENNTKVKAEIDNYREEENVKENDYYEVSQSMLQGLSPGKRIMLCDILNCVN